MCGKDCIWNPATCSCENGKYLACINDDSVIACDEIIEKTSTLPKKFNEKKQQPVKQIKFYTLLAFFINYHNIHYSLLPDKI